MAQVDFTNAILDVTGGVKKPFSSVYLGFTATRSPFWLPLLQDSDRQRVSNHESMSILLDTPSKQSLVFTGDFQRAGTEFWLGDRDNSNQQLNWHVSNISFNAGDTYNFQIDIEIGLV